MKKYLMTWYGITDLRASLGMELSVGPVLGALLAEDYTDVIILGFTNQGKSEYKVDELERELASIDVSDSQITRQFIHQYANTTATHQHFNDWLIGQLKKADKKVNVNFNSVNLTQLNDTQGIYDAAIESLKTVASSEGDKLVTLYLSPGTPVMAFVWAFAALRYPMLKKRMIAASQPEKPPENISLPNEWLEWHGRQVETANQKSDQYDVIFHLFGEQRMPSLLGIIQFTCKKHIFVNSVEYPADIMKQFLGEAEYDEIAVDPYNPENVRSTILGLIEKMPAESTIGFNLTGGTKLMHAGALAACRKINATPFYFDRRSNQLVYLNDFNTIETKLIPSVETFFQLNGENLSITQLGHWVDIPNINSPDRKELTNELWQMRSKIAKHYKKLVEYNDRSQPFELNDENISVSFSKDKSVKIRIGGKDFSYPKWLDFGYYLAGKWFEEYLFMKLQPLFDSGIIKDMRIGLTVSLKRPVINRDSSRFNKQKKHKYWFDDYQELDIVFTDGRNLYIIECKAGNVTSEHVMKLQNVTRYFGGAEGRAILASVFSPASKVVKEKIRDLKIRYLEMDESLLQQIKEMIQSGRRY